MEDVQTPIPAEPIQEKPRNKGGRPRKHPIQEVPPDPKAQEVLPKVAPQGVEEPEPIEAPKPEPVIPKPSRITVETILEFDYIRVTPGEPVVLMGLEGSTWKDIAVVSSHGARGVKVKKGQYTDFKLDSDTNRRMRFTAPEVGGSARLQKKEFKAQIIKKG